MAGVSSQISDNYLFYLALFMYFFVPPFTDICLVLYAWNENTSMLWSDKALLTKYKLKLRRDTCIGGSK